VVFSRLDTIWKKNTFFIQTKWTVKKSHLHPGRGMSNTSWNPE